MTLTARERAIYTALIPIARGNVPARAREVRQRAYWPEERMEAFRLERLRAVLAHAHASVPYYRRLFDELRFDPRDLRSMADLSVLPPLTRGLLNANFDRLRAEGVRDADVVKRSTGGTSGQPVTVLLDRPAGLERALLNHRMMALMGRTLGVPTLMVAGSAIDAQAWATFGEKVKNRLFNVEVQSSFGLTPESLELIAARIRGGRFRFVIAYASVFDILAARARAGGATLPIANIVPTAELVTPAQRQSWKEAFGCNVYEIYGSRELTSIAGELPDHRQLAVNSDYFHVEATDESGRPVPAGSPGILTITNLHEYAMPLIRYQLGDAGTLHPRPADSPHPFPRLSITHGRVLDVIRCPNGKLLPGEFFPHLMKEVQSAVERFQVVHTELDRLLVRVVAAPQWSETTSSYLLRKIEEQVGAGMRVSIERVDRIESSASGKYRPTISLLSADVGRFTS